jgi:NAD(P)-dependent dehydrogenase (short-subunit alcohol dehydrogenase family)
MVGVAVDRYGKLNVLFNNAAVYAQGTVVDTPEEVFDRMIAVNLKGVFLCCKAAVPVMISGGGGSIINMSSSVGWLIAAPGIVAYAASKGGVTLLTRAMALDHAKDHIRVNCICPGPTDTPMLRRAFTDEQLVAFGGTLPVSRLGRPEEIASAALWLASDEASFVTGVALPVDGGQTAQ